MSDLIDFVLDAHGGAARWERASRVSATVRVHGDCWAFKGQPDLLSVSASSTAARAIQLAAQTVGLNPDDPDVIVAARAAGDAACALTAGADARAEIGYFLDCLGLARASDRARSRHVA